MIESLRQISLIKSFRVNLNLQCISDCSDNFLCSMAIVDSKTCNVYNRIQITNLMNLTDSFTSTIYVKYSYNQYLIHYWPFNGNYYDIISNANLFNGLNNALVTDRYGRPSSSLYLNYGSLQAPNGAYIYGDFTLTTWVKMYALENARRLFIIPTSSGNNIFFSLTLNGSGPYYYYKNGDQAASSQLTIGKWQHLAFTIKGSTLSIYIDGILKYNGQTTPITNEYHTNVFLGYQIGHCPNAELDDVKIFNRSLTQTELIQSSLEYV